MNAVTLGPLMLSADRLAAILGMAGFLIAAAIVGRRWPQIGTWAWPAISVSLIAARLGHVALNWSAFAPEPLQILAFWTGGFHWPSGALALAVTALVRIRPLATIALAAVPIAAGTVVWNTTWQLTVGQSGEAIALPEEAFVTVDGTWDTLDGGEGQPIVINLWASWCPPCRREMPMMADVSASIDGVRFVFANQGEDLPAIERFLEGEGITLDHAVLDRLSLISRHYRAPGLPATLFISADGTLAASHLGEISRADFQNRIDDLKSGSQGD